MNSSWVISDSRCLFFSGDDSSNEGEGEGEEGGEGEKTAEAAPKELPLIPEEEKEDVKEEEKEEEAEQGEEEGEAVMEVEKEDDICFPDTSISLSHLQPSRWVSLLWLWFVSTWWNVCILVQSTPVPAG